jgi:hypothetical protein
VAPKLLQWVGEGELSFFLFQNYFPKATLFG